MKTLILVLSLLSASSSFATQWRTAGDLKVDHVLARVGAGDCGAGTCGDFATGVWCMKSLATQAVHCSIEKDLPSGKTITMQLKVADAKIVYAFMNAKKFATCGSNACLAQASEIDCTFPNDPSSHEKGRCSVSPIGGLK